MDASIEKQLEKHLVWKERKILLPIALSFAAMFLIGLAVITWFSPVGLAQLAGNFMALVVVSASVIGLAMGVIAFSPERENGTDLLMGAMPVTDRQVGQTKLRQAAIYFLSFFVFASLVASVLFWLLHRTWPWQLAAVQNTSREAWLASAVVPVECFLWSLFASQRFRKPIQATVFAAFFSLFGGIIVASVADWIRYDLVGQQQLWSSVLVHLALIVGLAYVVIRKADHWLREGQLTIDAARQMDGATAGHVGLIGRWWRSKPKMTLAYPWRSLFWQSWRSTRWQLGLVGLISLAFWVAFIVLTGAVLPDQMRGYDSGLIESVQNGSFVLATMLGIVLGLSSFASDQTGGGYLFFQQQADHPKRIWCSRLFWITLLAPLLAFSMFLVHMHTLSLLATGAAISHSIDGYYQYGFQNSPRLSIWKPVLVFVAVAGMTQLISILSRSGIALIISGLILGSLTGWWFAYLAWLDESLWLIAWPLALLPYVLSWWYSASFIRGGRAIRWTAISSVVMLVALAASVWGLRHIRLTEVPQSIRFNELSALFEQHDNVLRSDTEKYAGALAVQQALADVVTVGDYLKDNPIVYDDGQPVTAGSLQELDIAEWQKDLTSGLAEANREVSVKLQRALADPSSRFFVNPRTAEVGRSQRYLLYSTLTRETLDQLDRGAVDSALEALLAQVYVARWLGNPAEQMIGDWCRWVRLEGQSAEKLREGLVRLNSAVDSVFAPDTDLLAEQEYFEMRRSRRGVEEGDPNTRVWRLSRHPFTPPWEIERSQQIAMQRLHWQANDWKSVCDSFRRENQKSYLGGFHYSRPTYFYVQSRNRFNPPEDWANDHTTVSLSGNRWNYYVQLAAMQQTLRYIKVRLALEVYRLEQGAYPPSLADLKGSVLDAIPVDPATGRDFAYYPEGLRLPVISKQDASATVRAGFRTVDHQLWEVKWSIPAKQPFVLPWSGTVDSRERQFAILKLDDRGQQVANVAVDEPYTAEERQFGLWIPLESYEIGSSSDYWLVK